MSNLLQASSLLLAVLALVYSQWYPEIRTARKNGQSIIDDSPNQRRVWMRKFPEVKEVFWSRTVPLFVSTLLLVIVLIPDAVSIVVSSANTYIDKGLKAIWSYDAVSTIYVLAVLLTAGFCVHLFYIFKSVRKLKNDLNTERFRTVLINVDNQDGTWKISVSNKGLVERYVVRNLNEILKKECGASAIQLVKRKRLYSIYAYTMKQGQYDCLCKTLSVKPKTATR